MPHRPERWSKQKECTILKKDQLTGIMPRPTKKAHASAVSGDSAKTSDIAPESAAALTPDAPPSTTPLPADAAPLFAAGSDAPEPVVVKPKSAKASRRAKTCERCDERRKREREYARVSRERARIARLEKKDEAATEPEKAADKPEAEGMKTSE